MEESRFKLRQLDFVAHDFSMMVNFTCQLDWTMECPEVRLSILGMSVPVLLDEINI